MPDPIDDLVETLADFAPELVAPAATAPAAPEVSDETEDLTPADLLSPALAVPATAPARADAGFDDETDDIGVFQIERDVPDIVKPWMRYHKFTLVRSVQEVRDIVDAAIKHGRCSLDTETEGLDSRIRYDAQGNPVTYHQIVGYCICVDGVEGFYIPIRHKPDDGEKCGLNLPLGEVNAEIKRLCWAAQPKRAENATDPLSFREFLAPPQLIIYFWNAKFDQEMLYPVTGIDWWHPDSFEDGMLAAFCDYSADKNLGLKTKANTNLRTVEGEPYEMIDIRELFIRGRPVRFATLSPDEPGVVRYGCSDAICTYLLCESPRKHETGRKDYVKLAKDKYAFTYRLEKQTAQVVRVMERYRVRVNKAGAKELLDLHRAEFQRIDKLIRETAQAKGYNLDPSSTQQLSNFLFTDGPGCLNLSPKPERNEASGQYKTDGETLEGLVADAHAPPILKWIVEYRGVEKMLGTYLEHLNNNPDSNSELRFNFKQTGAGTGRFSAPAGEAAQGFSGIPIHGIPSESTMRKLFEARDGYTLVKADYAGQELRIAANESKEPVWIKEFLEGDGDLHTITAMAFFNKSKKEVSKGERKMGKIANFALIYGGGPAAIIRATGCDKIEASRRKQAFDKAVPVFAGWIKNQQKMVKRDLGVWTPFKRWLAIPDANNEDRKIMAACERYAVNYPIQGSGADIMKISMVLLHKEFHKRGWLRNSGDDSVRMLLTVHDEIVFEIRHDRVAEAVPLIVQTMAQPGKMAAKWVVPLIVEPLVGPNWGTGYKCEPYKEGHKLEEGDVLLNGFVYGTIRTVDLGKEGPGPGEVEHFRDEASKKLKIRILDPAWLSGNAPAVEPCKPVATSAPGGAPRDASAPAKPAATPSKGRVVSMKIGRLTRGTVRQVFMACVDASDAENGKILHLKDLVGETLIDPSLSIKVDPKRLAELLDKTYNLSDGRYTEEN